MYQKILQFVKNHGGYWFGHLPHTRRAIVAIEDWLNNRGRPTWSFRQFLARAIHQATGNTIFYLDYENGLDANNGSTWALAWKTITSGATAARIAPGDVIRIAKSPAPASIGNATWNNLSKTVTLASAQTLNIDRCEVVWTGDGDTTVALTPVATDAKEGSYCMKLTLDASPQVSIKQAYYATGELDLSPYQKISFWIKNSAALLATHWTVRLCSDTAGETTVDTFIIPAIPSTARWIPITLARNGGGNLGASIKSIAIYTDTVAPTASSNILIDDFVACAIAGLNLQSLISKNSAEQGGAEGWYGIQSINGTTILLDTETNTKANAGRGYSGTTETVATYKRETIKTDLAPLLATVVQEVQDNGVLGNNIQFQGGWNTSTTIQEGETYFDGLNGNGYGLQHSSKSYITLNYLNFSRYYVGIYYASSNNNTIITLSNANNNSFRGIDCYFSNKNTIITLSNANNNDNSGICFSFSNNNTIITLSNANNNDNYGISYTYASNNTIVTLSNANNNSYGVLYSSLNNNNTINILSTSGNAVAGVWNNAGINYIFNALMAEATKVGGGSLFANSQLCSHKHDRTADNHWIFTDGGTINSLATDRVGGTGIMWKLAITSANRASNYPLYLSIAKIAVTANNLVTVKAYMKKGHATNVVGKLVCRGRQLTGVPSNVVATKANDTDWEELTITFTPTEAGVIEIEAWAEYSAGNSDVYVEDMTITQA